MDDTDNQDQSGNDGDATRHKPEMIDTEDPTRLVRTEIRQGSFPGNERVRVVLPSQKSFRRVGTGMLEATE
ncbi:MAG TPA: hypothetical protein VEI53_02865, partial [Ktedonobacteraceae bacterium]|nr:hypothetical protein [Ktedonobacteraceae bacterium]